MVNVTEDMKAQAQRVFEEVAKLTDMANKANPGTDGHLGVQNWWSKPNEEYHGEITVYGLQTEDGSGFECADIKRNGHVVQKFIKHEED